MKVVLVSAVALIDRDGRVLLAQRPEGKSMAGLWEFPGGKVEPGETPEAALIRELHEELGIATWSSCLAPLTFASHAYPDFHLLMPLFACRKWEGIAAIEGRTGAEVGPRRGPARLPDAARRHPAHPDPARLALRPRPRAASFILVQILRGELERGSAPLDGSPPEAAKRKRAALKTAPSSAS
jgi:8-oxo-dGTP diphosphatase